MVINEAKRNATGSSHATKDLVFIWKAVGSYWRSLDICIGGVSVYLWFHIILFHVKHKRSSIVMTLFFSDEEINFPKDMFLMELTWSDLKLKRLFWLPLVERIWKRSRLDAGRSVRIQVCSCPAQRWQWYEHAKK